MKLQDALQKVIRKYGTVILGEKRLVFLLDDYRAFAEYPAVRPVMKAIAENGYGKELCDAAEIHPMECIGLSDELKRTLAEEYGFRKDFADYSVDCIVCALGILVPLDEPSDHGFDPARKSGLGPQTAGGTESPDHPESAEEEDAGPLKAVPDPEGLGSSANPESPVGGADAASLGDVAKGSEDQDSADYQFERGRACYWGDVSRNIKQDYSEAARWWRKAAEQGHAEAQYRLASDCYGQGQGVQKSAADAAMWYRRAAEQGHAEAECRLGFMYLCGTGVGNDYSEAFRWFRKSAEQGNSGAEYMLGEMYSDGRGVERDDAEAVRWYRKAAAQNYPCAQDMLDLLLDRLLRESKQKQKRQAGSAASAGAQESVTQRAIPEINPEVFLKKGTGSQGSAAGARGGSEDPGSRNGRNSPDPEAPRQDSPEQEARQAHHIRNGRRFRLLSPSEWFTVDGRIGRLEFLVRYLLILLPLAAVHYLWCLDHESCVSADGVLSGCADIRGVPFPDVAHILGYGVMGLRWYFDLPGWLIALTAVPLWLSFVCAFYSAWIRRAHDLGGNGYTLIFAFITGMSFYLSILCLLGFAHAKSNTVYIVLLVIDAAGLGLWGYYGLRKGMNGTNYYGADPRGDE